MRPSDASVIVSRCLIVCCLVYSLVALVGQATSNVHSVWLDASDNAIPAGKQEPTGNSQRVLSQRTGLWSDREAILQAASSLQPAIIDQDSSSFSPSSSDRRSDSEQTVGDLATTSDWPANSRGATNGHVQFDEDIRNQKTLARSSSANSSSLGEQDGLSPTEAQNQTNYSPTTSQQSSGAVGFEDFTQTHSATPIIQNLNVSSPSSYTAVGRAPNRTHADAARPSHIYYLSEGDRWNNRQHQTSSIGGQQHQEDDQSPIQLTSHTLQSLFPPTSSGAADKRWRPYQQQQVGYAPTIAAGSRRKLHNSGTQYDLSEFHRHQLQLPNSAAGELEPPSLRRQTAVEQTSQQEPERSLIRFIDQLAPQSDQRLEYHEQTIGSPLARPAQIGDRHKRPTLLRAPHPFVQSPLLDGPLLVRHPHRQRPTGNYYPQVSAKTTPDRRHPQQQPSRSQLWRQKSASSSNRNSWLEPQPAQRSFLQSYVPSFGRPKLKPASALSNWIQTGPVAGGSRPLENAFYSAADLEQQQQRPSWNAANYHYGYEPPLGGQQQGSGHLYSLLNQQAASGRPSFHQRPTLAPAATNFVHRPQRDLAQAIKQPGAAAGFIPVLAVSVTRTSPVPMPAAHSNQLAEVSAEPPHAEMENALDFQQPPDSKQRQHHQQQAKVHFDDYGNYASGSSGNAATLAANQQRLAYQPSAETTTVKSALFGYLPHEAERPLLGAMNLLTPIQQQLAAESNRPTSSQHQHQYQYQQQHLSDQEDPPLGLRLQANSYVQNDIAHPFGSNSIETAADQQAPLFYLDSGGAGSSSSSHFAKHELPPLVQSHQQGLMGALLADASLRSPHLMAASELNPLVPVLFASPHQPTAAAEHNQEEASESGSHQDRRQQHVEPTRSNLDNKGNKKRSGDFFASAGQLLLSALPLLLAPTLGLMFASAPTAVARYQATQGPFGEANGIHSGSVPSSHLGSPNQGVVSNASPAPLLFTPSPLSRLFNSSNTPSSATPTRSSIPKAAVGQAETAQPLAGKTSASSGEPTKYYRPTVGPVQTLASWTGSTPPPHLARNYSLIMTTSGPPPTHSPNGVSLFVASNKSTTNRPSDESAAFNETDFDHRATHTIVLIHADDEQQQSGELSPKSGSNSSDKAKSHYDIGGYEGADFEAHFPALKKTSARGESGAHRKQTATSQQPSERLNRYHYSATIESEPPEGVAQHNRIYKKGLNQTVSAVDDEDGDNPKLFPVSRWPTAHRRTVSLVTSNGNKTMPDSSDKYSSDLAAVSRGNQANSLAELHGLQNRSHNSTTTTRAQQVQRRTRRDVRSYSVVPSADNEIVSRTTNITLRDGKRLVKIVKRRKLERPKQQTNQVAKPVDKATNNSSGAADPMLGESSSGRARFERDDFGPRGDHKSDSSKHIIATMFAQMNDPDESADRVASNEQLREHLLRNKIVLDRLASGGAVYSSPTRKQRDPSSLSGSLPRRRPLAELEGEEENSPPIASLSAGGRARLPSSESKITKVRKSSERRASAADNQTDDEEESSNLVLTDDTRKALTKLGNLLIKDTVQIPMPGRASEREEESPPPLSPKKSEKNTSKRRNRHPTEEKEEGEEEAVDDAIATEISFARTTPYPVTEMRSLQYRQDPNSTRPAHNSYAAANQTYPSYGAEQRYPPPMRDQVNLIHEDHIGGGYGPPDDRLGARDERRGDYGAPIVASRYAQPDRFPRPDPYSNYSSGREPPPPSSGYGNYYSRPAGREPPPNRSHYETRGQPAPHYSPSAYYQPHNLSSYPPPNHRPSDDYYDSRRDTYSAPYPADEPHHYNKYPADPRYPSASQEHESWPPRASASQDPARDYHSGYGRSSYPPPSLDRDQDRDRDRQPAYTSPPPTQQVGPPASRSIAGDSSAVNEYLKRVQFSDSDRDKLMASYLTCDGLLNDNDHCLERLSCEFSDLKNIAQANKLDRAVSSILLGHILINTYIPNQFKIRLKTASLFGYLNSGGCSKFACNKLAKSSGASSGSNGGGGGP